MDLDRRHGWRSFGRPVLTLLAPVPHQRGGEASGEPPGFMAGVRVSTPPLRRFIHCVPTGFVWCRQQRKAWKAMALAG